MSELLEACSRSETALRKRADATVTEGDLKAKLASARSELEAVSLERNALVSSVFAAKAACVYEVHERMRFFLVAQLARK